MSNAAMGPYSPESPRELSPETRSPIYPDRPIRPLPKRKLRERLSPDVADSIKYPPAPPTTTPLFYYPYGLSAEEDRSRDRQYPIDRQREEDAERHMSLRAGDGESDEEFSNEIAYKARHMRHSPDLTGRAFRYVQKPEASKFIKPEPPASTTSSVDGYDSFENTNNKKKRKIPTPGDMGGIHLSSDLAALGISANGDNALDHDEIDEMTSQYYGTGGLSGLSTQGISGPGRGRYGRARNGRSPLRTLSDGPNNWSNGRNSKQRPQWAANESAGIISAAIANAEMLPITPSTGQENVSLLQQQASKKSTPASTQFTFTFDSQVPGTVPWPGPPTSQATMTQNATVRATAKATQTNPNVSISDHLGYPAQHPPNGQMHNGKSVSGKKPRRRTGKEYLIAARQRREQQESHNLRYPPSPEDQWICEFCEYERIFGEPPEALIKQYELKDRQVRKQEAERRRLLEKAKMKGRKGKKGSKTATKNVGATYDRQPQQLHNHAPAPMSQSHSQETQSADYYEDDYEEEYAATDPLPPRIASGHQQTLVDAYAQARKHSAVQGGAGVSEALVS